MDNYTQRRLDFEKRLDTIVSGYCYAQDGGNGGYEFKDITDHIDTFMAEAKQELLNNVEEMKDAPPPYSADKENPMKHIYQNQGYTRALDDLLSSLDKEIINPN